MCSFLRVGTYEEAGKPRSCRNISCWYFHSKLHIYSKEYVIMDTLIKRDFFKKDVSFWNHKKLVDQDWWRSVRVHLLLRTDSSSLISYGNILFNIYNEITLLSLHTFVLLIISTDLPAQIILWNNKNARAARKILVIVMSICNSRLRNSWHWEGTRLIKKKQMLPHPLAPGFSRIS